MEQKNSAKKVYGFLHQAVIISLVLFISKIIESFIPIPIPASVIGLVLLFILLCTGIVKLGQVEQVGTALTNNIGLLFVPAGISVVNSLGVIGKSPILIIGLIIVSTLLLLICTGYVTQFIMKFTTKSQNSESTTMKEAHSHD